MLAGRVGALQSLWCQTVITSSEMDLRMLTGFSAAFWVLFSWLFIVRVWLKGLSMVRASALASALYRGAYVACIEHSCSYPESVPYSRIDGPSRL